MSEESKTIKIPQLAPEHIVTIDVSGQFLKNAQQTLMALSHDMGKENLVIFLEKLKSQERPQTANEAAIAILLAFVDAVEQAAVKQEKVTYVEVPKGTT